MNTTGDPTEPGILGIDNVLFDVGDLASARAHYGALGLVERFAFPGLAGYAIGGERPGLILREKPDAAAAPHRGPRLWVEVADVAAWAAAHDRTEEAQRIRTGFVLEVADPWGNVLGVTDYVLDPSRARPW
jgi:hypothetical protein